MSEQELERRQMPFAEFKEKMIAKAKRQNLKVQFKDGTEYDFRKSKPEDKTSVDLTPQMHTETQLKA